MFWCSLFGHNYGISSAFGNYAFCTRCGATLTVKDPYVLSPGERRWMHGKLMEMTEFGLEEVKHDTETTKQNLFEETNGYATGDYIKGNYAVQSKDPHEQ